ncbi:MAG: polymerase alpha subunit [Candidatus Sulfotelmatobacter sp.]|nr:polymerase alpha subunit [Candidatus Sulfotelmatobacter sp.]
MKYVELHGRSAFSFLEGASLPEALAYACFEKQLPAMALLDRNGVYGSPRFHFMAKTNDIQSHIGSELSVGDTPNSSCYYPILVKDRRGYQNLCRLITKTKLRSSKNQPTAATLEELEQHAPGLLCLTGDEDGPLAAALRSGGKRQARKLLDQLISVFGKDNLYIELQRHFRPEQESRNHTAIELARELNLPLLATNGVLYAAPDDRYVLDALTCVKHKCTLDEAGRRLQLNANRHIRSAEEMHKIFQDLPEAIANTAELSSRLEFALESLGYEFPHYPVPPGETEISYLRTRVDIGARERYQPVTDRVRRQLERELRLIEKLKLAGYFLIVWDIVRFCRENHILVQGRGSAANSAVCYSLSITAVDPIAMDLLFERFLSEERGEWPDIDLDLPSGDERERVIQYVYERYGQRGAAMTANVITYRSKLAAREMGKVLGFQPDSLARLSAVAGSWEWRGPDDNFDQYFSKAGFDLSNSRINRFLGLCKRVIDLPRHLGQHSGGMVICQGTLDSVVPLEPASMPNRVVVQWDKDDCEQLGIVKVDLLGLGMMAALRESMDLIRTHHGEEVDLAHLPADQPDVYEAIRHADTVGTFQIESRAQMASLPRNNPHRFYDLVVQVALIRPGPIVGQMTNPYLNRRMGKEPVTYPHPSLVPVLERTLGVPLFQEQLLRMAMLCANFTGGEAEELRRALGSKRSERRMKEIEIKLRAGMTHNGILPDAQDKIVQFVSSFALYGFPESHSASFALLAYASAFLKVRYLAAFTCALLNNQPMGFYSPATLVKDAQIHGLKVRPIDINSSEWNCTLEGEQEETLLRLGLRYVRGLRRSTGEALVGSRRERSFASISELTLRVPELTKSDLRMLAMVGALNNVGSTSEPTLHRRDALWQIEKFGSRVPPMFEGITEQDRASPLKQMDIEERLVADFHGTGMTVGPHPMAYRRAQLQKQGIVSARELKNLPHNKAAVAAGAVITRQRPGTANGLIFLTLEDETGHANIIVMPDVYSADPMVVLHERFVRVQGRVQSQDGVVHLRAQKIIPLTVSAAGVSSHDFH